MTRILAGFFLCAGLGLLAVGWGQIGYWPVSIGLLLAVLPGIWLLWRRLAIGLSPLLVLAVLAAGVGLWQKANLWLALAGLVCCLAAWDLEAFSRRLRFASPEDHPQRLEMEHLGRLLLLLGLGLGASASAMLIRIAFNFERVMILSGVVFVCLGVLVNWLRSREN